MESDKAVALRFVEMINRHDLRDLGEVVAEDVTETGPVVVDAPSGGLAAFREGWQTMLGSFPDLRVEVLDLVGEPGKVVARIELSATNTGYYRRGLATGKHATWGGFLKLDLREGRITHVDALTDRFGVLQQLGIIGDDDELAADRQPEPV